MRNFTLVAAVLVLALISQPLRAGGQTADTARQMLSGGTRRGLVVQVGCGNGELLAELAKQRRDVVQGIDVDAAAVDRANAVLQGAGLRGPATAVLQAGYTRLPYADNIVNVLIVGDPKARVERAELLRVLAPYGVLYTAVSEGGELEIAGTKWTKYIKPYPAEMDSWPEYRHDASQAAISQDQLIGPMTSLRWLDGPQFNGFSPNRLAISAGGRVFFVLEPNPLRKPEVLRIEARDAFNGTLLWEVPVAVTWAVADESRVYTQLEKDGPVVALDAATGRTVVAFEAAGPAMLYEGSLVIHDSDKSWTAFEPASGRRLRQFAISGPQDNPVLIAGGKLVAVESKPSISPAQAAASSIVCFDFATGKQLWKARNAGDGRLFSIQGGLLFAIARAETAVKALRGQSPLVVHAYSVAEGTHQWEYQSKAKIGGKPSVFYIGDRVWLYDDIHAGTDGRYSTTGPAGKATTGYVALDPKTGKQIAIDSSELKDFGRCGPDYATVRYILGMDLSMYDLNAGRTFSCYFVRGDCNVSSLPANGLLYEYGNGCVCRPYIGGISAAASAPVPDLMELNRASGEALDKGPAYGALADAKDGEWPMHRANARRSGAAASGLTGELQTAWRVKAANGITPAVVGGGMAFVASPEDHRVIALDAATGSTRWTFSTGGRIDSAPTYYRGLVLCGSADGFVYCLCGSDGRLVWRYRAAPADRSIVVRGQLESSWPVSGSVLVDAGVAYVTAGRHADLDGGLLLSAIEPASGKLLWNKAILGFGTFRSNVNLAEVPQRGKAGYSATYNDLLISDGKWLFIGAEAIDLKTHEVSHQPDGNALFGGGPTLLGDNTAPTPAWANRSAWSLLGPAWTGQFLRDKAGDNAIWGNLIVFNNDRVFAVRHDYPDNRTKTDCRASVFAVVNRHDGPRFPTPAPPRKIERQWSRTYTDNHPRLKAMALAGDVLLVANQPGGSAPENVNLNAGELMLLKSASGEEAGRVPLGVNPLFDGISIAKGQVFVSTETGELISLVAK